MNDHCAVYHSRDDRDESIFVIVSHDTVFSYFVDTDNFELLYGFDAEEWLTMSDANQWWEKLA